MFETWSNKKIIFLLSVLMVLILSIPLFIVYFNTPDGYFFNGRLGQNEGDYFVYFSQIQQAKEGKITFNNLFTSEEHNNVIFNPVWLTLGWLAKITNLSNEQVFHFIRLLLIPCFVLATWYLVDYFLENKKQKILAVLLIIIGGGFTGYANTTDASPFNAMLFSPHLILSLILLVFSFVFFDKYLKKGKKKYIFFAGVYSLLVCLFHPYHISTLIIIFGLFAAIKSYNYHTWQYIIKYFKWLIFILPVIIYYWWMFKALPFGDIWMSQSDSLMRVRNPWELILSFAPFVIFGIIGFIISIKKKYTHLIFVALWAFLPFILMSIPAFFRMRTTGGVLIPLAILSSISIFYFVKLIKRSFNRLLILIAILILLTFNSFFIWFIVIDYSFESPVSFYISKYQVEAFDWINKNIEQKDSILASWYISNLITGYTGSYVYIGHGIQTPRAMDSFMKVKNFFSQNSNDASRLNFLYSNSIDYVWYSDWESRFGEFNPFLVDYLSEKYSNPEITIFMVNH